MAKDKKTYPSNSAEAKRAYRAAAEAREAENGKRRQYKTDWNRKKVEEEAKKRVMDYYKEFYPELYQQSIADIYGEESSTKTEEEET